MRNFILHNYQAGTSGCPPQGPDPWSGAAESGTTLQLVAILGIHNFFVVSLVSLIQGIPHGRGRRGQYWILWSHVYSNFLEVVSCFSNDPTLFSDLSSFTNKKQVL